MFVYCFCCHRDRVLSLDLLHWPREHAPASCTVNFGALGEVGSRSLRSMEKPRGRGTGSQAMRFAPARLRDDEAFVAQAGGTQRAVSVAQHSKSEIQARMAMSCQSIQSIQSVPITSAAQLPGSACVSVCVAVHFCQKPGHCNFRGGWAGICPIE